MKKILVGMSGGVDSSVTALLLKQQGYEVGGITLQLCPNDSGEAADAKRVCEALDIPHRCADLRKEFHAGVIQPFVDAYLVGKTPNPCVFCNRTIKFGKMLEIAREWGYDGIATGHYAQISQNEAGRWILRKAPVSKDQSYVLYSLTQEQLAHTKMPLNALEKPEVRALAEQFHLPVAHKPDSQEICFVPDQDYAGFIERDTHRTTPPGPFVDCAGNVLGQHRGILHYTIGQRKGLGVTFGKPMYVTKIDSQTNRITLGEEGSQYAAALIAEELNWIPFDRPDGPMHLTAKVRYQAKPAEALITPLSDGTVRVEFEQSQRSVTPGQTVVFYDGDLVVGGGTIRESL